MGTRTQNLFTHYGGDLILHELWCVIPTLELTRIDLYIFNVTVDMSI